MIQAFGKIHDLHQLLYISRTEQKSGCMFWGGWRQNSCWQRSGDWSWKYNKQICKNKQSQKSMKEMHIFGVYSLIWMLTITQRSSEWYLAVLRKEIQNIVIKKWNSTTYVHKNGGAKMFKPSDFNSAWTTKQMGWFSSSSLSDGVQVRMNSPCDTTCFTTLCGPLNKSFETLTKIHKIEIWHIGVNQSANIRIYCRLFHHRSFYCIFLQKEIHLKQYV